MSSTVFKPTSQAPGTDALSSPAGSSQPTVAFIDRHIGTHAEDRDAMLRTLGLTSLDELVNEAIPDDIRSQGPLQLPDALSETEALATLRDIAGDNQVLRSFIGQGYYGTIMPPVIRRNLLENPGWYTQYTPYQAEISQGRLEMLLNFQTLISDLCGLPIANASLLDEATAAAEAMTMLHRLRPRRSTANRFFVATGCHPQVIAVVQTRAKWLGIDVIIGDERDNTPDEATFGHLLAYPCSDGEVRDHTDYVEAVHESGGLAAVCTDLLALTLLEAPGHWGADVVLGNSQRLGVPMGYGGPHAAFFATREAYRRQIPGRIIGVSRDSAGRPALRMALQTREQHIRRKSATSNICTAQVLLANIAAAYSCYHGASGLRTIATRVHGIAEGLRAALAKAGWDVGGAAGSKPDTAHVNTVIFDTIIVHAADRSNEVLATALAAGINLRRWPDGRISLAMDETVTSADVDALLTVFGGKRSDFDAVANAANLRENAGILGRKTDFMTDPCFAKYRTETAMLRYLTLLADKDLSLTRAMIPLGSCTMKLNAAAEMEPVSWPEFGGLHPFVPRDQAAGYDRLFRDLESWLGELTGFDAISLQPNAGSQGEYTGLLAIRGYHANRDEADRDVCLIPTSAHGTNPASAVLAGLRVVAVSCDTDGNIDVADLRKKAAQHADKLAALMVTYPSTHGVFETAIREICAVVHSNGGMVYMDGANLNAMVGLSKPREIGADVCHLNLHKTFAIPHGGGGPGMGPIGVVRELIPFLPGHPSLVGDDASANTDAQRLTLTGAVSAAAWGSASILPISWAYIAMSGGRGLTRSSMTAILHANYIANRLDDAFPVLYRGADGRVAHECIIDLRPLKKSSGVTVDDVAKRLMDYGFHAPTMSWPVMGTMMIEPTESEPRAEIDRFCNAMLAIRAEIAAIEAGDIAHEDSALHHAPHPAATLLSSTWDRAYSREFAAYPLPGIVGQKYWPPVGRIDNAYGDRHLVCSCPSVAELAEIIDTDS